MCHIALKCANVLGVTESLLSSYEASTSNRLEKSNLNLDTISPITLSTLSSSGSELEKDGVAVGFWYIPGAYNHKDDDLAKNKDDPIRAHQQREGILMDGLAGCVREKHGESVCRTPPKAIWDGRRTYGVQGGEYASVNPRGYLMAENQVNGTVPEKGIENQTARLGSSADDNSSSSLENAASFRLISHAREKPDKAEWRVHIHTPGGWGGWGGWVLDKRKRWGIWEFLAAWISYDEFQNES
ncbi:hypothetical protein M413DRAFT_13252 [Hebeloma cylindrosporum]|uniref:Uncharacterized protein n=1 Tax=Hebeloma cylindrosporum TaxID=76867 RepID=A0A0C3C1H1_HEBCY|nr:hypothetical protein M413DRAFT_13252 [Hebeloma cylindrosporum h7]